MRIEWPTAVTAWSGRGGREASVLGGEVGVLVRVGGLRGFGECRPEPLLPLRVLPERRLPADWSLPGQSPAQEAR